MERDEAIRVIERAVKDPSKVQAIDLLDAIRALDRYLSNRDGIRRVVPPNDPEAREALEAGQAVLDQKMEEGFDPFQGLRPAAPGGPAQTPQEPLPQSQQTVGQFTPGTLLDRPGGQPVDASGRPVAEGVPSSAFGPGIPVQVREDVSGARAAQGDAAALQALQNDFVDAGRRAGVPEQAIFEAWQNLTLLPQTDAFGNPRDVEDAIRDTIAQWEAMVVEQDTAAPLAPPGVQLPEGFTAPRTVNLDPADRARFGSATTAGVEVAPRYFAGDELSPLGLGFEEIAELQSAMVDAGLMDPDEYHVGWWDPSSIGAYSTVLGYANLWGLEPEQTIDRLAQSLPDAIRKGRTSAAKQQILAQAYVAPDYATLSQHVKQMIRSRLGREPSDKEISELAGAMAGWDRAAFQATRALDAQAQALAEQGVDPETAGLGGTAIDPAARLGELFDQRFGAEERRLDRIEDVRSNQGNMFRSLSQLQTMMGG